MGRGAKAETMVLAPARWLLRLSQLGLDLLDGRQRARELLGEQAGRVLNCNGQYARPASNPHLLHLAHADVVGAPVVEAGGFGVRVPCHALRDLDTPAVRKVVRNPRGAEGVAAYRRLDAGARGAAAHHLPGHPSATWLGPTACRSCRSPRASARITSREKPWRRYSCLPRRDSSRRFS